jgi:MFS family permease
MLKSENIIAGLQTIVNNHSNVAIIWHGFFYILIASLIIKWEPSNRTVGLIMSLPLLSVAILAWITGNPFNGIIFSVATMLLIIFGFRANSQPIDYSQLPFIIAGILMIIFGLIYPHFTNPDSILKYLYASPAGLIPCPTLSIVIGFLLLYNGFGSQSVTLTLIVLGLFYGIFGVLKLAVYLDLFLLFGTITLLVKYILLLRTPAP